MKYSIAPWQSPEKVSFPTLHALFLENRISILDYAWTLKWLQKTSDPTEEIALALCYLLLSASEGHLCVQISENDTLIPHMDSFDDLLFQRVVTGFKNLPENILSKIQNREEEFSTPFCEYEHKFYIRRHWIVECQIIFHVERLLSASQHRDLDINQIQPQAEELKRQGWLNELQCQAVVEGCLSPIYLITGGPGTGKTYTAAYFLKVFLEALKPEERHSIKIALASPTGKAAAQLQKSLSRLVNYPLPPAKTLHSLLGINSRRVNDASSRILDADLILVDECSMIDAHLMALLLSSIKEGAHLLLMGDAQQLPSVEAGSIFFDLLMSGKIPCKKLEKCLRTDRESILNFAEDICLGNAQSAIDALNRNEEGLSRLSLSNTYEAHQQLWGHIKGCYHSYFKDQPDCSAVFEAMQQFRILTPLRRGIFGTEQLNNFIFSKICAGAPHQGWMAIPIMITGNDYKLGLFNGDNGILLRKLPWTNGEKDFAWFPQLSQPLPACFLPLYDYAYCLSIHKSQGSEFNHVLLLLPEGSQVFGREILYTGVTRTKQKLQVAAADNVLEETISRKAERRSGVNRHNVIALP